jgi:glycosyltransferase involved in cell wall biosynthesis
LCSELNQPWVRKRLAETHELLRGAAAVLAPSQFAAGLLRKQFGDVAVSVVPHGLQSRALSRIHKQYSKDDGVVFGYCGGLVPHKGVHVLIKAFRKVQTDRARLAIHGSASNSEQGYAAELRRLADGDDRISFHGHFEADELGSVLDSLDVVVVPSLWYETYSFSLNEALAWGVPVVASGLGVMLDKIKDGENGSTFRAGDEDDLARKLKLIIDDPPLLNGMRDSLQNFTFSLEEEEAYCYERIYCEVLRERGDAGTGLGGTVPVPGPGAR